MTVHYTAAKLKWRPSMNFLHNCYDRIYPIKGNLLPPFPSKMYKKHHHVVYRRCYTLTFLDATVLNGSVLTKTNLLWILYLSQGNAGSSAAGIKVKQNLRINLIFKSVFLARSTFSFDIYRWALTGILIIITGWARRARTWRTKGKTAFT